VGDAGHPVQRRDEGLPDTALLGEYLATSRGQAVIAPPALAWLLDPAAVDQAFAFEPVQRGIQGGDVERDGASGAHR
jgi:hypothetical protein